MTALLHEPDVRREPVPADDPEVPDVAAVEESGSVVLCGCEPGEIRSEQTERTVGCAVSEHLWPSLRSVAAAQ